jgi:hypothetical protein
MRRRIYGALFVVGVVALGVLAWMSLRQSPPISVTVMNNSHKAVASAKLVHENGVETIGDIPVGQSRLVAFRTRGETSYSLNIRFEDGTELTGGGNYAEAGYSFSDSVSDSTITNKLEGM